MCGCLNEIDIVYQKKHQAQKILAEMTLDCSCFVMVLVYGSLKETFGDLCLPEK